MPRYESAKRAKRAGRFGDGMAAGTGGSRAGAGVDGTTRRKRIALAMTDDAVGDKPDWSRLAIKVRCLGVLPYSESALRLGLFPKAMFDSLISSCAARRAPAKSLKKAISG